MSHGERSGGRAAPDSAREDAGMSKRIWKALGMACVLAMARTGICAPGGIANDTPLGSGPRHAAMEVDPGLPTHTLYHPADITSGDPLPVVLWGNGACANGGDR